MPRDLLRQLINERVEANNMIITGQTISQVYTTPFDTGGIEMTVVDVLVQQANGVVQISSIPVAANNQEMRHAAMGSPIQMRRSRSGRVEVVGLDKRAVGEVRNFALNIGLGSTSADAVSLLTPANITLGGLQSALGFNETPLQAIGLFDSTDTFVQIGWP